MVDKCMKRCLISSEIREMGNKLQFIVLTESKILIIQLNKGMRERVIWGTFGNCVVLRSEHQVQRILGENTFLLHCPYKGLSLETANQQNLVLGQCMRHSHVSNVEPSSTGAAFPAPSLSVPRAHSNRRPCGS